MGKRSRDKLERQRATVPEKASRSLLPTLIYLCALLALASPILPPSSASMPVTLTQASVFQALVMLMFGLWVPLAVTDRRYRPRRGPLTVAVLAFAAVILASLAFAADADLSFWSQLWRLTGVWSMLHYIVWFLILSALIREEQDWRAFLGISCAFALISGLYGLKQWLADPLGANVTSTLGNQSLLAAYVLPHIFIAGYLLIGCTSRIKYFYWTVVVVGAFTIAVSASRGAAVALAVSAAVALAGLAIHSSWPRKRRFLAAGLLIVLPVLAVGVALLLRTPAARTAVESHLKVPRFVSRVLYRDIGADRKLLWSYALRGFAERPWFGWGNEMYGHLYDKYYDFEGPDRAIFNERWQDRAHNQYLDTLVSYGLVGFIAWLAVWVAAFVALSKAFSTAASMERRRRLVLVLAFLVGYLSFVMFIFDTPAQLMLVFGVLALVAGLNGDFGEQVQGAPTFGVASRMVLLAVAVPAALFGSWVSLAPTLRAIDLHAALMQLRTDRLRMDSSFAKAFEWPNVYVHGMRYAAIFEVQKYMELAQLNTPEMESGIRYLAGQAEMSAEEQPYMSRYPIAAATADRILSVHEPAALERSEMYAQRLIDLVPNRFDGYAEMAEAAIVRGDYGRALLLLAEAEKRIYDSRPDLKSRICLLMATAYAGRREFASMNERLYAASKMDQNAFFDARPAMMLAKTVQPGDRIEGPGLIEYLSGVKARYSEVPNVRRAVELIEGVLAGN